MSQNTLHMVHKVLVYLREMAVAESARFYCRIDGLDSEENDLWRTLASGANER